jgi:iron complex outermembrane recepter protein
VWPGGDLFLALEYYDRSDLDRSARPFFSQDLRPFGGLDQRSTQARPPNIVVAGVRRPLPSLTGLPNRFDVVQGDFLPHQTRYNGFLSVRQEVTDAVQLWYEGFFSRRRVVTENAPLGGSFSVPATNPFYVRNVPGIAPGANQTVEYRLPRAGATTQAKEVGAQSAVGVRWDLPAEWQLNAYVSRSHDEAVSGIGGEQINNQALPAVLADPNPATALNVYGGPISDALYSRIIAFRLQKTDALEHHYEVKLDGPLFSLPGGEVRAALGASYHEGSFRYQEYQSALSPTNTPSTTNDRKNRRRVSSLFGEVYVPLVSSENAMPFVHRLDLSVAARHDQYSDFGDTTNPKVSVVWEPVEGLALRGTWGKSFRAPSLVDTGNLNFVFIAVVPDPANGNRPITQVSWNGSNPNLEPETATTYSVGADWRPTFLPGLSASATYYKVDYQNRIQGLAASLASESIFRQFIIRNPPVALIQSLFSSGWLVSTPVDPSTVGVLIDGRRNNLGALIQTGLDIDVRYRFATPVGDFTAGITHSEIFSVKRQTFPSFPFTDVVNLLENPLRSRGRASLFWGREGWSVNAFYNYGGSYVNTGVVPNVKAEVQKTVDLNVAYRFEEDDGAFGRVRVALNAQNVFDEQPPIVINGSNAWDNTTASAIGRFISIDITKSW